MPRAESRPEYYARMIKWQEKHQEYKDRDLILNHKNLYRTLVQKTHTQNIWVQEGLSNGCKDLNWLLLHKKIPVRSIMYAHRLCDNKNCPRSICQREEAIVHVMWGCPFAREVWGEMQRQYDCLKGILYDDVMFLTGWEKGSKRKEKILSLVSLVKLYLWKARQGYILGSYKWTVMGTCRMVEKEIEKVCCFKKLKWGWDAIKDRWKAIFRMPPNPGD